MHSLAVRDETVKLALLTEAAVQTSVKMLSSISVAVSDIDEILHEMLLPCDEEEEIKSELLTVTEPALN